MLLDNDIVQGKIIKGWLRGIKYAFEAMQFITMTKGLYTPRVVHQIIYGQFVNHKGGAGNNYAKDLKMEDIVRNNKDSSNELCANKTLKVVQRSLSAESTAHMHADK
ncbi:Hypothetical predicted protein [Paramuricea clavata]|uniref:Uncharacterized protein n=1 Tax=Paramuricea clavata TaxID=317549 RepID=A0A7D9J5Q3_PARCT|nr:Hypothetical predicted protein [Paramuricea clavata]